MTDDLLQLAEDARAVEILELWHNQRAAFEQEGIGVEYRHPDSYEFQDNTYWERSRFRHHFHHDR